MKICLCLPLLLFVCSAATLSDGKDGIPGFVEPEYLDSLLREKKYEEFARLSGIVNVELVKPGTDDNSDPMFNEGLEFGDILLTSEQIEQARQGILFDRYPGSKWPNRQVPFVVSNEFSTTNRNNIANAVKKWNDQISCVKWVKRTNEKDYVNFFPGNGCWSYLGRIKGSQSLSLQQNGCFRQGTILHEMDHAVGFAHEHNRLDRDEFIEILWENIPDRWKSQYKKTDEKDFGIQDNYDYYSVMHYPVKAPETNKPAFRVKKNGIRENEIGQRKGFTDTDINKIQIQYC